MITWFLQLDGLICFVCKCWLSISAMRVCSILYIFCSSEIAHCDWNDIFTLVSRIPCDIVNTSSTPRDPPIFRTATYTLYISSSKTWKNLFFYTTALVLTEIISRFQRIFCRSARWFRNPGSMDAIFIPTVNVNNHYGYKITTAFLKHHISVYKSDIIDTNVCKHTLHELVRFPTHRSRTFCQRIYHKYLRCSE